MNNYLTRITALTVAPEHEPLYSEMATTVAIVDEAVGEFVEVSQNLASGATKILINPDEWHHLRAAIDRMITECRERKTC